MAQNTTELTLFESKEFGTLRTVQKDGEAWFVVNDIMNTFLVTNRSGLMQYLDDDEKGYTQINTPGGPQHAAIVSESGLYSLLFRMTPTRARGVSPEYVARRSGQLRAFRRWITHEVIPAIRRNGFYAPTEQTLSDRLSPREQLRAAHDVSGLLKSINHVMSLQGSTSRKIASTVKGICEHYGIPLPDDFVEPERTTQTTAADMNEAHLERIRRRIISAEELRQAEERARRDAFKTVARMREEFDLEMAKGGRLFMDKLVLNITELAEALGIGERAARELTHRDGFPRLRMNGIKVPVRELQDWLSRQCEITDTGEAD